MFHTLKNKITQLQLYVAAVTNPMADILQESFFSSRNVNLKLVKIRKGEIKKFESSVQETRFELPTAGTPHVRG